jgi:hypothetical protein
VKLTDEQKVQKRLRDQLRIQHNRVMGAWSFGQLKTWGDVLTKIGYAPELIASASEVLCGHKTTDKLELPALKDYLQKQVYELEKKISKVEVSPVTSTPEPVHNSVGNSSDSKVDEKTDDKNYGLKPSPNEKAFLYWFQKKAAAEILKGIGL